MIIKFNNLEDYYKDLEDDQDFLREDHKLSGLLRLISNSLSATEKKKSLYEVIFHDFKIEKGVLIPKLITDKSSYPSIELFDDNFEYLKSRGASSRNPKYKAKYNHILWLSPKKHFDFAKQAIECYFLLLKNSNFPSLDNLLCTTFRKYYENLFILSQTVDYKKKDAIDYFISILDTNKINDFSKTSIMNFITENLKKSDTDIFQTFFNFSKNQIAQVESKSLQYYLDLLIILSRRLGLDASEFHVKLGDFHIAQIGNKTGFVTHHFYLKALKEYKNANDKSKIESTSVLIEKSKKNMDLKKITFRVEDENFLQLLDEYEKITKMKIDDLIENGSSLEIYNYLIEGQFLPEATQLNNTVTSPIMDLAVNITYDLNKNFNTTSSGGINPYHIHVNHFSLPEISSIFISGIKNGKISSNSLIDFLRSHSWYRHNFTYIDINNEQQGFNWIELLAPSLQSFFVQIEFDIKNKKDNKNGYILSTDSLLLKFEGLLRELSRMAEAQTIELKEDGTTARISFEKLLENEKISRIVDSNDIAFFKFLFTSEGINLRNNIAHCFFNTENYDAAKMLLLIVALLRLGKYDIRPDGT